MAVKNSLTSMWAAAMQPKQEDYIEARPRGSANVGVDSLGSRDRLAEGRPSGQPQVPPETSAQPLLLPEKVEATEECKVSASSWPVSINTVSSVVRRAMQSTTELLTVPNTICCLQEAAAQPEKKRRRGGPFAQSQLDALESLYQSVSKPNTEKRGALAQQLGLTDKQVLAVSSWSCGLLKAEQHPQHAVGSSWQAWTTGQGGSK